MLTQTRWRSSSCDAGADAAERRGLMMRLTQPRHNVAPGSASRIMCAARRGLPDQALQLQRIKGIVRGKSKPSEQVACVRMGPAAGICP